MTKEEASTLLDFLAYITQNFGKKVIWCPLIQSEQGLGKSIIGTIMINAVFGIENAGTVDSNVVNSPQTSWATTGVFKVIEELKLAGHNRYEVINRLKPFITNPTVLRVEKYEASTEVPNFTNFIAFTNFKDALPLTDADRRWWIVYSKLRSLDQLEKLTGKKRDEYFKPLHELAHSAEYGAEFHKWLLEYEISENFNPNFAPESTAKKAMVATEESSIAFLSELRHLLEAGYKGVNRDVVSTKQLKRVMDDSALWDYEIPSDKMISSLLKRLNFTKVATRVYYEGEHHYIWSQFADEQKAIEAFKASMEQGEDADIFDFLD
jgi:hypothetical protein